MYTHDDFLRRDPNDQQSLTDALAWASYRYYIENDPPMSDFEFDMEFKRLQELERASGTVLPGSPTQRVGSDIQGAFHKRRHRIPMQSIENVYTADELLAWLTATRAALRSAFPADGDAITFTYEPKYDGLSISLIYEHGVLTDAVTRGNQVEGESVIQNVRTIRNVPLQLPALGGAAFGDPTGMGDLFSQPTEGEDAAETESDGGLPAYLEVRGEVLMPQGAFERLNAERVAAGERPFANKRNAASGSLKQLDPKVTARRGLIVMAYAAYSTDAEFQRRMMPSQLATMQLLSRLGFDHYPMERAYADTSELTAAIEAFDGVRRSGKLPYDCDGVVVKVNERRHQEHLGLNTTFPNWCKARKFPPEARSTRMTGVVFQVGMTGHVTPVAQLEPIAISGSIVARATLNNESYIRGLGLRIGQYVFVQKAGEVIPQVTGVDTDTTKQRAVEDGPEAIPLADIVFPTACPECGTTLGRKGEFWICPNHHCRAQVIQRLEYWCGKDCANIRGLGPAVLADLVDRLDISSVTDLYDVLVRRDKADDLFYRTEVMERLGEGYGERSVAQMFEGVRSSIGTLTLDRMIGGFGIDGVGKVTGRLLAEHFPSLAALRSATMEDLLAVEGIGEVMARAILDFLGPEGHMEDYACLDDPAYGFTTTYQATERASSALEGVTVIFTGTSYRMGRDDLKAFFTSHGAKYVGSVSGRVNYVITGDAPGQNKLDKARQLGIEVVPERDFYARFGL